jgi:DNA-binding PadR family transcriptional regulator
MNETKIFRVIKNLEDNGIIKKGNYNKDKWNKTNWYAITKKGLDLLKECGYEMRPFSRLMQNDIFDCVKMNDGACQNEQSNNTDNNNTDNNKEKVIDESITKISQKSNKFGLDMSFVDESFIPILIDWLEYKKEKKQAYKQRGFATLYKNLMQMSGGNADVARKIVEQSMQNNYAGLFPLRQTNNYSPQSLPTGMIITESAEERNKKYEQSMLDLWK